MDELSIDSDAMYECNLLLWCSKKASHNAVTNWANKIIKDLRG